MPVRPHTQLKQTWGSVCLQRTQHSRSSGSDRFICSLAMYSSTGTARPLLRHLSGRVCSHQTGSSVSN